MGPLVDGDPSSGSPSGAAGVPQQTINDSTGTTEPPRAAKRRHDELEEKNTDAGPHSEERNVRMREEPSTPLRPVKVSRIDANGQGGESPNQTSSEPDSPCSFRTAHSTSDHGDSPSFERRMDVDSGDGGAPGANIQEEESQEQNIAQTLSNLAETLREPTNGSAQPQPVSSPMHDSESGPGEQRSPRSFKSRPVTRKAARAGSSQPVTRATLAAAAAAAKAEAEAEALAAAHASAKPTSTSSNSGFDSLAHAINTAQQANNSSEPATSNDKNVDGNHSSQPSSAPTSSPQPQANANTSADNMAPANGQDTTGTLATVPNPMTDIVRVAEAAVAAQRAAASSSHSSTPASTSPPPSTSTTITNKDAPQAGPSNASSSQSPNPSIANNPYAITTQYLKSPTGTPTSPGVPMSPLAMNPYAMYYGTGTPSTPSYPPYANPYYYMGATMPSPNGMYPAGPSVPTTPASASAPPGGSQQSVHRATHSEARPAKPKRLKAHTVTSKSFSIPMVPRDKVGKPMLPLNVGIMTVLSLGSVCMREHFHTERYIFPVGYEVTRRYLSTIDPSHEVVYHCTILDGGDGPKFQIIPSDAPDRPVIAGTATGAWSSIVKQANAIRNRQHSNSVSGPDFFGLGQNTIKHLIQELPNARNLRDYVWQNFHEGGPLGGRHAAVIPALPEEYDGGLPVGGYYQGKLKRDVTSTPETPKGLAHYPSHVQAEARRMQDTISHVQAEVRRMQDRPPQSQGAGPSQPPQQQMNGQPSGPLPQSLQIHPQSMAEIAQALSNQATPPPGPGPPPDARQAKQYSNARSQPPVNSAYNPDPGIPPGANPSPAQGVPNTFASIMNAFPAGVPPAQ